MNQFPAIAAKIAHPKPTMNAGVAVPKSQTVACMSGNTNGTNPRKAKRLRFRRLRYSLHGSVSAIAVQCSVLVREVNFCKQPFTQLCAFPSPFPRSMSDMEMLRQRPTVCAQEALGDSRDEHFVEACPLPLMGEFHIGEAGLLHEWWNFSGREESEPMLGEGHALHILA